MGRLRRFKRTFETDPEFQTKYNIFFAYFWLANIVVASVVFFLVPGLWAKAAVFYLVIVSLWANFATHYGAVSAAEGSDAAHDVTTQ